jgi:hypothetical protein
VAHCGAQAEGSFLYTLTLTDLATGWTECLPLLSKCQRPCCRRCSRREPPFRFRSWDWIPITGANSSMSSC